MKKFKQWLKEHDVAFAEDNSNWQPPYLPQSPAQGAGMGVVHGIVDYLSTKKPQIASAPAKNDVHSMANNPKYRTLINKSMQNPALIDRELIGKHLPLTALKYLLHNRPRLD